MFEDKTFEAILAGLLARAPGGLDKREGSVLYDALAPAAMELANLYVRLDAVADEAFADTAHRGGLIRRCAERGIAPRPATKAVLKGEFSRSVAVGSRFSLDELNYTVIQAEGNGARLECETPGAEGNRHFGRLIPIEYIPGLESAELTELLIPGEDEEGTEALRARYFATLESQAFGGNIADYKEKAGALPGVGGVRVVPAWNGGGTVKLVITTSEHGAPAPELVRSVQQAMDPAPGGTGLGLAPIDHVVTVEGARAVAVDIAAAVTLEEGFTWQAIEEEARRAVEGYLLELRRAWADTAPVVRVSQVENRLLSVKGVLDIAAATLNGKAENIALDSDQVPVLGVLNG